MWALSQQIAQLIAHNLISFNCYDINTKKKNAKFDHNSIYVTISIP